MSRDLYLPVWRDAVRDSELGRTAKLVAFVLSTYFTGDGRTGHDLKHPAPSKMTLARGASLSAKHKGSSAVDKAIDDLEGAGLLAVVRRRGWQGYRYQAVIPREGAGLGQSRTKWKFNPARSGSSIPRVGAGESAKGAEGGALSAADASNGAAARALPVDQCGLCGERRELVDDIYCAKCAKKRAA